MHPIPATCCVALLCGGMALAASPPADPLADLDALKLADQAPAKVPEKASNWRAFAEAGVGQSRLRAASQDAARLSLDLRYDGSLAPGLRLVFSDRLDLVKRDGEPRGKNLNTLREAFVSWTFAPDQIVDAGRINVRHGAALGFNPTDWFKEGALRSTSSVDPIELRENRQGTFALRAQQLWPSGSVSATFSPELSRRPSDSTFSLDTGSTNPRHRWQVNGSYKFSDRFAPELLLHGGPDTPVQLGLSASTLVGESTVAFGELSAGKGRPLADVAAGLNTLETSQRRAVLGMTYTTGFNLSLTAEAEFNDAAPGRAQWASMDPGARLALLATSQRLQDLPSRQALFIHATWKDAWVRRLDLSAFVRQEQATDSRAQWLEARYRWDQADLALQWLGHSGAPESVFGALPLRRSVELVLRVYH